MISPQTQMYLPLNFNHCMVYAHKHIHTYEYYISIVLLYIVYNMFMCIVYTVNAHL